MAIRVSLSIVCFEITPLGHGAPSDTPTTRQTIGRSLCIVHPPSQKEHLKENWSYLSRSESERHSHSNLDHGTCPQHWVHPGIHSNSGMHSLSCFNIASVIRFRVKTQVTVNRPSGTFCTAYGISYTKISRCNLGTGLKFKRLSRPSGGSGSKNNLCNLCS